MLMNAKPLEIADVFARFGPAFRRQYGSNVLPSQRRAMRDILGCMTAAMGGGHYLCFPALWSEFWAVSDRNLIGTGGCSWSVNLGRYFPDPADLAAVPADLARSWRRYWAQV